MKKLLFILSFFTLITSCTVDNYGCTDPDSINYDPYANVSDGSCEYEGSYVLWYGQQAAQALVNAGSQSLYFYVNNELIGSQASSFYWSGEPDCGQSSSITINKNLGSSKGKSYTFSVVDVGTQVTVWSGILNFEANTCISLELLP